MCGTCCCHVWITTVKSEPALGDATALISNARSFPSRRTAVGQIEGRMADPAGWFLVTMAVKALRDWPPPDSREPIPPFLPPPPLSSREPNSPDIGHFRRNVATGCQPEVRTNSKRCQPVLLKMEQEGSIASEWGASEITAR